MKQLSALNLEVYVRHSNQRQHRVRGGSWIAALVVLCSVALNAASAATLTQSQTQGKGIAIRPRAGASPGVFGGSPSVGVPPERYALIIGCGAFKDARFSELKACENDARELEKVLLNPSIGNFKRANVKTLIGPDVTRKNVLEALQFLQTSASDRDLVLVFFSGHGMVDLKGNAYWVMHDTNYSSPMASATSRVDLDAAVAAIGTTRLVTVVDSCHSGATVKVAPLTKSTPDMRQLYAGFSGEGRVLIASSTGDQLSIVIDDGLEGAGHSAFAWHFIQGLKGKAAGSDGVVTLDEVWSYSESLARQTAKKMGGNQTPWREGSSSGDFLLTFDSSKVKPPAASDSDLTRLSQLKEFLRLERITATRFDEGERLLRMQANDLTPQERACRQVFIDMLDGKFEPLQLDMRLQSIVWPGKSEDPRKDAKRRELNEELRTLRAQIEEKRAKLDTTKQARSAANSKVYELETQIASLNNQLQHAQQAYAQAEQKYKEAEAVYYTHPDPYVKQQAFNLGFELKKQGETILQSMQVTGQLLQEVQLGVSSAKWNYKRLDQDVEDLEGDLADLREQESDIKTELEDLE